MINIGHLAKTYGLLPSEVSARATAFDIMVTDVYLTWENHKANPKAVEDYDIKDLQNILDNVKNGS